MTNRYTSQKKTMLNLFASLPLLLLAACTTTGGVTTGNGGAPYDKAAFQSLSNQIASRINRSGATMEGVSALKYTSGSGSSTKHSAIFSHSGANISDGRILRFTETERNSRISTHGNNMYVQRFYERRLPLHKVRYISVSDDSLTMGSSALKSSYNQSTNANHATLRTRAIYQVRIMTEGKVISERWTNTVTSHGNTNSRTQTKKLSGCKVATFQTRAEAVQFAKDFHRLVTMLRGEGQTSLNL